jgi:hypothetical protein
MASANVLFPEPLFPITTVRLVRGSSIQTADGRFLSHCPITVAHYQHCIGKTAIRREVRSGVKNDPDDAETRLPVFPYQRTL